MSNKNALIQGIKVIPREITFPIAKFLSEEEVKEYQARIKSEYKNNPLVLDSLDVLSFNEILDEPIGSNFWALAKLTSMGIKPASTKTLDILIETNPDTLKGNYEDVLALVLRSPKDVYSTNNPIIKNLISQLKKRNKERTIKYPVLISGGLQPVEGQTNYGLVAKLSDKTKVYFNVRELAYENNLKKFNRVDERGVPVFDENGERTFYAKNSGLSGLCLGGGLDLYSPWGSLADSCSDGRVVVEVGEANAQKFFYKN